MGGFLHVSAGFQHPHAYRAAEAPKVGLQSFRHSQGIDADNRCNLAVIPFGVARAARWRQRPRANLRARPMFRSCRVVHRLAGEQISVSGDADQVVTQANGGRGGRVAAVTLGALFRPMNQQGISSVAEQQITRVPNGPEFVPVMWVRRSNANDGRPGHVCSVRPRPLFNATRSLCCSWDTVTQLAAAAAFRHLVSFSVLK